MIKAKPFAHQIYCPAENGTQVKGRGNETADFRGRREIVVSAPNRLFGPPSIRDIVKRSEQSGLSFKPNRLHGNQHP